MAPLSLLAGRTEMGYSYLFDTITFAYTLYLGVSGYDFQTLLFRLKIFFTLTNSVDPDEMFGSSLRVKVPV